MTNSYTMPATMRAFLSFALLRAIILINVCCVITTKLYAQTYKDTILAYRQDYKAAFLSDKHSPLKGQDTTYLKFYSPDVSYRVIANFAATPQAKPFDMPTHSGKNKLFRQYGVLKFTVEGVTCSLQVYQNLTLKDPKYKNHFFIPFMDKTNLTETYGGGRYIDVTIEDIVDEQMILDFNKCYNPYCAYADGYNCPIPPVENRLQVSIKAGEKRFGKAHD